MTERLRLTWISGRGVPPPTLIYILFTAAFILSLFDFSNIKTSTEFAARLEELFNDH